MAKVVCFFECVVRRARHDGPPGRLSARADSLPGRGGGATISLATNLARLNAYPLAGYVVLGSTGEFPLLSEGEKERVIGDGARAHAGRRLMIAGTGGRVDRRRAIRLTRRAAEMGADAAIVITPQLLTRA